MNRPLVTGAGGMLGHAVVAALAADPSGPRFTAYDRGGLDLLDPAAVRDVIGRDRPDVVVNCAGSTAVDDAEIDEASATAINGDAVRTLAEVCADAGATLVHVSTDYVFDGTARTPYAEDAPPAPVSAYGRGKLAGERAVLSTGAGYVVRTAWLYGGPRRDFVSTMIALEAERETVGAVADQVGQPTWAGDLAAQLLLLARSGAAPGVYHGTNGGTATWYDLAREVFTLLGADPDRVRPVGSDAFPRPAARPAYSVLGHDRWAEAGLGPMRHWRDALHAAWPSMRHARQGPSMAGGRT
ncbi:dTDP-4-dehydrorhamnose reductase [Sphaerisporangium rubeum]|uniref:dTDP-4-dehydrorhamnose reductase n=1 Tax=Sphaerisporangium rubeum TaxID=321317 RepID=A0A7X0IAG8_9ACTN|nr:dTDP-4-dehydrorhamnose reductase [Sphaerisporangium rubeum]